MEKKLTEKELKEKINASIKPRLKKIGNEVKEINVGQITRADIVDLLKLKDAKKKEEKVKVVSDFFNSLNKDVMTEESKRKILDDLDSY